MGSSTHVHARTSRSALHDLAHWQLASPSRRKVADYGLGPGQDSNALASLDLVWDSTVRGIKHKKPLRIKSASLEEARVSALGIIWEASLGLDPVYTLVDHSWVEPNNHFEIAVGWLTHQGYLSGGHPVRHWNKGRRR